jgi:hypothetical protein
VSRFRGTTFVGLMIWVALPILAWVALRTLAPTDALWAGSQRLWQQWWTRSAIREARLEQPLIINFRDPVFYFDRDGRPQRLGHVTNPPQLWAPAGTTLQVHVYQADFPWQQGRLELHRPARNLARVAEVMMTDERIARLNAILLTARQQHEHEILAELGPLFRQAVADLRPVLEEELRGAVERHRPRLDRLSDKYHAKIVNQRLVPLVKTEILPVVQRQATPLLERIGSEMWQKVSLWRFAWRYVYDGSVAPTDRLVNREWNRFVQQHAMPILESHTQDFVDLQTAIVRELAANPLVTQAIRDSLGEVLDDEEVWGVVRSILAEGITENPRVEQSMRQVLQAPRFQQSLQRLSERLEPYAVLIGQEMFGTPEKVNEEFALVLRHMILNKDQQWLVWVPDPQANDTDSLAGSDSLEGTDSLDTAPTDPVLNSGETSGERPAGGVGASRGAASEGAPIPVRAATEIGQPPFFVEPESELRFEPAMAPRGAS